ncbi:dual specificity mitogen-activated protein kinase kinase 7-like isoform X2 [Amphiura filiformis]|uniref:dual specificity mitogen-activated protein kinase kinase 7-like isoform X2 n=1 Tax=Amphiura filiformis TaxID=82378 RepID=UPI003B219BE2
MSSSVELQRKLKRIEAKLHTENEARKMDHMIDFTLESPKAPRQRPDLGLHRCSDRNEAKPVDRPRIPLRHDSPKHRPRPDPSIRGTGNETSPIRIPDRPRIDFKLDSPKTHQRQRPELPGLRPCIGNDTSFRRMMIDRPRTIEFKLDSPTRSVKKQIGFMLDSPTKAHRPRPVLFPEKDGHTGTSPSRRGKPRGNFGFSRPLHRNSIDSREIDRKLQEIMKQTGKLSIDCKVYKITVDSMISLGELGLGSCGHVVRMQHKETGSIVAVKQMRRSANKEENKRILMDLEVVLKSHHCPFIVQCLGAIVTASEVWICMEQMATCLEKLMKRLKEPIPEQIIGKMVVAIVNALNYLKEVHGLMHRDVKPSNMLLDEKGTVKLCDFGISGRLVDSKARTRSAGCAAYMAPERIDPPDPDNPDYDVRADVWSLGLSLVELATGEFPYKNCSNDFEVLARVLSEDPPRLPLKRGFSVDFHSFIQCCLTKDCKKRPKYKQLMDHSFFKRYDLAKVDVATWFATVMAKINSQSPSPKTSPGAAQLGPPTT